MWSSAFDPTSQTPCLSGLTGSQSHVGSWLRFPVCEFQRLFCYQTDDHWFRYWAWPAHHCYHKLELINTEQKYPRTAIALIYLASDSLNINRDVDEHQEIPQHLTPSCLIINGELYIVVLYVTVWRYSIFWWVASIPVSHGFQLPFGFFCRSSEEYAG